MKTHTISFEPLGLRGRCRMNESLLACARRLGLGISSVCGGQGTCHSCRLRVLSGTLSEPTPSELESFSPPELEDGWRLACQAYPASSCRLAVPLESMPASQRLQVEGLEVKAKLEPPVKVYRLRLQPPSLFDQQADAVRLLEALNQQHQLHCNKVDFDVLCILSPQLRSWNWQCQASVRNDEVIALGLWPSRQLGLAIDLGTSKIAGYLVDLSNGRTLAARGVTNPQVNYGEDIISRISYAMKSQNKGSRLQKLVVEALNQLAIDLCTQIGAEGGEIVEVVVVGNTAMHHLFLGLPVRQLALSPYVPTVSQALDIKARDLGLHIAPGAYLHLLPNIAGFVGADHTAVLLAIGASESRGLVVALDIGTNSEVSLIDNGEITTVSCASGPAFEGGHIKHGMRATTGAIERLRIANDSIQYQTIDGAPPIGICGSGILDAMAQLYLVGVLGKDGKMIKNHPRVRSDNKRREFVLVSEEEREGRPAIVITQQDVRKLQLAKAAIRAGIQVLLETKDHSEEDVDQVVIAGAFGSYIDVTSARTIGMLPPLPLDRFRQIGNAAGMGAKLALISLSKRAEAQALTSRVHYIELASAPNFNQTFIQASFLGEYRLARGKREEIG